MPSTEIRPSDNMINPMLDIAEYARSLFIFSWVKANRLPIIIESIPTKINISDHTSLRRINGMKYNLRKTINTAIFGSVLNNIVVLINDPW